VKIGPYKINCVHQGDALERLKQLPDESIQCCITSPPYWGLRDYGTASWEGGDPACDHKIPAGENDPKYGESRNENSSHTLRFNRVACHKCGAKRIDQQIGIEETHGEYVERLVKVFREVKRVLRKDGTFWLNVGDSYGRGDRAKFAGDKNRKSGLQRGVVDTGNYSAGVIFKGKQLVGIPWRLAFALQDDGWRLRSDIIWHKPNPMPESVRDRPTKSHEYIFLLTKSEHYFYDAEAISEPAQYGEQHANKATSWGTNRKHPNKANVAKYAFKGDNSTCGKDVAGNYTRNKRSVWTIPTRPYQDAHFATFPTALIEPMILAGTSEKGCCSKCGTSWQRVVERKPMGKKLSGRKDALGEKGQTCCSGAMTSPPESRTIGWKAACKCSPAEITPCIVLDPFSGSGTTISVAMSLGRVGVGFDLNEKYATDIAAVRIKAAKTGMDAAEIRAGQKFMFEEEDNG